MAYSMGQVPYPVQTANIYITGGTVGGIHDATYDVNGGVYGGARQNRGGTVNLYMTGGLVNGGVYGGSNASGTISGNITMKINDDIISRRHMFVFPLVMIVELIVSTFIIACLHKTVKRFGICY